MARLQLFLLFLALTWSCVITYNYKSTVQRGWTAKLSRKGEAIGNWKLIETELQANASVQNDETVFQLVFVQVKKHWQLAIVLWDDNLALLWTVDRPLKENSMVRFEQDGNLVLKSEAGVAVWNSSTPSATQLKISNYGSMSLLDQHNVSLWSSFSYPTNYMTCGQVLSSSASLVDGNYSLRITSSQAALYYLQYVYQQWSFGTQYLNSTVFGAFCCDSAGSYIQIRSDIGNVSQDGYLQANWVNCTGASVVAEILTFPMENGSLGLAMLERGVLIITKMWSRNFSSGACIVPDYCGTYGLCKNDSCSGCVLDDSYTQPFDSDNFTSSCRLKSERNSGKCKMVRTQNSTQNGLDYWRNTSAVPNSNEDRCKKLCHNNSSCKAAFYQKRNRQCLIYDEIDTLRYTNEGGYDVFIKICYRESYASLIIILPSVAASCIVVIIIVALILICKRKRGTKAEEEDPIVASSLSRSTLKRFSFEELQELSNGFKEKLGVGGFGTVYKGVLSHGECVAVKILKDSSQEAQDFCAELSILSRARHLNLVQLLGFCTRKSTRALVYEYMANGSLDQWLSGKKFAVLGWKTIMEIAIGAAKGIAYLHEGCPDKILHLDLKPQNILLGENFEPKVADFGLSKLMERENSHVFMTTIRGTPGYLSPELCNGDAIDEKSDVYSFGVVLFEILAGAKLMDLEVRELWNYGNNDNIHRFVDKNLRGLFDVDEATRMFRVALVCIHHNPQLRPFMYIGSHA